MSGDTGRTEQLLDELGGSVRAGAERRLLVPDVAVSRGRRRRRARRGLAGLGAVVLVLAGLAVWRVVPARTDAEGWAQEMPADPGAHLFAVRTSHPTYWREAAFFKYDGGSWTYDPSSPGEESLVDRLPWTNGVSTGAVADVTITLDNYSSAWVPTGTRLHAAVESPIPLHWMPAIDALHTEYTALPEPGATYTLQSRLFDPATRSSGGGADIAVDPVTREVPAGLNGVRAAAARLSGPDPWAVATALQRYLRAEFTVISEPDVRLSPWGVGLTSADMERLLRTKRGRAEQLASLFALLARATGLPARMVHGYLPGVLGEDGARHVYAVHRHAWVEVWLAGTGWVGLDPSNRPGTTDEPF